MDPKELKREEVLAKRRQLDPQFIREASKKIARRFVSLEEFRLSDRMALYADFQGEVQTAGIFKQAHALRKEVYYPAVDSKSRELKLYRVQKLSELNPGYAGILEPPTHKHPLRNINYLNIIIVPGIVFDRNGNRLGYGKGFYDRLLQNYKGIRIAFAYDFQISEPLSTERKDQRMDIIITEERVIRIL